MTAALESLDGQTAQTPLQPRKARLPDDWLWMIPSYLAGVRGLGALGDLPAPLLIRTLCAQADADEEDRLSLIQNLPRLIRALGEDDPDPLWHTAALRVAACRRPSWLDRPTQLADHLAGLRTDLPSQDAVAGWLTDLGIGGDLGAQLGATLLPDASASASEVSACSTALIQRLPQDDWDWQGLDGPDRFGLTALSLLLAHWGDALPLGHRIALVRRALERCVGCHRYVLPALVRLLKLLLNEELVAAGHKDVAAVARAHVQVVAPLVSLWNLPGTVTKDLATIVCRSLMAARRNGGDAFIEVWTATAYALPSRRLLREATEYCSDEAVAWLLATAVTSLDACHAPRPGGPSVTRAYHAHCDVLRCAAGPGRPGWVDDLERVTLTLARHDPGPGSTRDIAAVRETLLALTRRRHTDLHEAAELLRTRRSRPVDSRAAEGTEAQAALARRVEDEAGAAVDGVISALRDVRRSEREAQRGPATARLPDRWRDLLAQTAELERQTVAALPYVERSVAEHLFRQREAKLSDRFGLIVAMFEAEDEPAAALALAEGREVPVVQDWMLRRHMLVELAGHEGLTLLKGLLSWPSVAAWIGLPLVATAVLEVSHPRLSALPWAVAILANLLVLCVLLLAPYAGSLPRGRLFLPQVLGAMFLGVQQVIAADEAWRVAFQVSTPVRALTLAGFLLGAYFFTRELILGDQLRSREAAHRRRRSARARSIMALGMWQAFALVTLFGVIGGTVMADSGRADLLISQLPTGPFDLGRLVPHELRLGPGFLQLWEGPMGAHPKLDNPAFRIFPWVLVSWTFQVYFFSAIIERVLSGRGE